MRAVDRRPGEQLRASGLTGHFTAYDDEVEALALAGQVGLLRADVARFPKLHRSFIARMYPG
jgi:hypothetical protein